MENAIWKLLAFIICGLLLFLSPLMSLLNRQDDIAYGVVFAECNRFVDSCRDTGYITPNMYEEFIGRLNSTGNKYSIKMSHVKRYISPIYRQTAEVLTFSGEYEINHTKVSEQQILDILFPKGTALSVHDKARRYDMRMGDLLFIEVRNEGKTMAAAIRDMILFRDNPAPSIFVRSGGMVRNEAY